MPDDQKEKLVELVGYISDNDLENLKENITMELVEDDKKGEMILRASKLGYGEIVSFLLDAGVNPNVRDKKTGKTPVIYWADRAAKTSKKEDQLVVEDLLAHKADPNIEDKCGWTALRWATDTVSSVTSNITGTVVGHVNENLLVSIIENGDGGFNTQKYGKQLSASVGAAVFGPLISLVLPAVGIPMWIVGAVTLGVVGFSFGYSLYNKWSLSRKIKAARKARIAEALKKVEQEREAPGSVLEDVDRNEQRQERAIKNHQAINAVLSDKKREVSDEKIKKEKTEVFEEGDSEPSLPKKTKKKIEMFDRHEEEKLRRWQQNQEKKSENKKRKTIFM